jgi:hypothetical protein
MLFFFYTKVGFLQKIIYDIKKNITNDIKKYDN